MIRGRNSMIREKGISMIREKGISMIRERRRGEGYPMIRGERISMIREKDINDQEASLMGQDCSLEFFNAEGVR